MSSSITNKETDTKTNPMTTPALYAVLKAYPKDVFAHIVVR
jgi:hypothetical protein